MMGLDAWAHAYGFASHMTCAFAPYAMGQSPKAIGNALEYINFSLPQLIALQHWSVQVKVA